MYQNVIKSVEKRKMLEDQYSEALKFNSKVIGGYVHIPLY